MRLKISAASNVGCVRHNNEDMILVGDRYLRDASGNDLVDIEGKERCLIALADGMGGHNSGDVASRVTLENLHYFFYDMPLGLSVGDFNEAIFEWLESINNIIDSKGREEPRFHDMGTTLVAFAYYGGNFYWMNCGDSRVYRMHNGQLRQLSTDHSLSNLMGSSEHTNIITNCIGGGCKMSYIDMVTCTPDVQSGDIYMLCSDGLTDMLPDADIQAILQEDATAERLCAEANAAGGFDNVSVCIIRIL